MTPIDLSKIMERIVPIGKYIEGIAYPFKERFLERKQTYQLNEEAILNLKNYAKDIIIVVFSAEWCKDCAANVPVLALIAEKTGVNVRVFGELKKNALNPNEKWKIPPSPPEVKTFNVKNSLHNDIYQKG